MIERRKYVRLQAHPGVRYQPVSSAVACPAGRTLVRNLSGGGLCIYVAGDLREGDLLRIELEMPYLEAPVCAIAEVVWIVPRSAGRNNEVGMKFRDIADRDLHHILEYVHTVGIG